MDQSWIEQHYSRIHRAAWLMTGCAVEAEDLAQETFIVALDRWDSFAERSRRETWLFGILLRLKARHDRSLGRLKRRMREYFQRIDNPVGVDPAKTALQQEWRQSVWAEVAQLPPPQRDAVVLRFAQQMSYDEMAEVIGCPVGTAKTRLHHALKRLERSSKMRNLLVQQPTRGREGEPLDLLIKSETCRTS